MEIMQQKGVQVATHSTHTLFDPEHYLANCKQGKAPNTYVSFQQLFANMGEVRTDVEAPTFDMVPSVNGELLTDRKFDVPSLQDMGYVEGSSQRGNSITPTTPFKGGESEALRRLQIYVASRPAWVRSFAKPDTAPNSLEPSTTVS